MGGLKELVCAKHSEQCQAHSRCFLTEFLIDCDSRVWYRGWHELSSHLLPSPHTALEETSFIVSVLV